MQNLKLLSQAVKEPSPGEYLRTIEIAGCKLTLDLRFPQERAYYENSLFGLVDAESLTLARFLRPGDIVLDAGANIGYTALHALSCGAAKVYAFEPAPELYERLASLPDERLHPYQTALSDRQGEAEMLLSQSHNQGHSLNPGFREDFPAVYGEQPVYCTVPLATLDSLFNDLRFDYMKIDVEGSEAALLRGARQILTRKPPRIMQIESYDRYFPAVHEQAAQHFKHVRRAALAYETMSLKLAAPGDTEILDGNKYLFSPPVYLYANDASLFGES